ncbi:MAG TPA: Calx-beta domain-containing protein, partial [Pyrinomonadaceae bacterium]|nr:Calx-beta domain-containing protein [Pyrinomonadaceae bacterium]
LFFDLFDPGHQVAGGDDQNTPFRGDDDDGAGGNPIAGALNGGFEFNFGGPVGTAASVWNAFFFNSNGNVTFGTGDTDNTPTILELRQGLPRVGAAWSDLNPNARAVSPGNFPVLALGFSNVNAFKVRYINVPTFGNELCSGAEGGAANTLSTTLYDDGATIDENASNPLNPANPIGNNAVPFDLQEGPTDRRFAPSPVNGAGPVGELPRPAGSGLISFVYGRMDLIGSPGSPVLTGYSVGLLDPLNPPGLCEENLSQMAVAADGTPFGVLPGGQTGGILPGLIGEGTEPTVFEFFNSGQDPGVDADSNVFQAKPDFDLRFEGNNPTDGQHPDQPDPNRERIDLFGIANGPPASPLIEQVIPLPVGFTPNAGTDLLDALGGVDVLIVGSGFFPNEVTTVCLNGVQPPAPGVPTTRAGKIVTSAVVYSVDNNLDSIPDATFALTNITPVSKNLVTARMSPLATAAGTAFPFSAFTGSGIITLTTTFTFGDNNIFGPFIRTASALLAPGTRAPIVLGVTQTTGDCSVVQNVSISGVNFNSPGPVTAVFAVEDGNPGNVINATSFVVATDNIITAQFNFGGPNPGKRFLIFVTGPGGTSRNLTGSTPSGVPTGNEQGNIIAFNCTGAVNVDTIQFSATNVDGTEGCAATNVTVSRVNPGSGTVTVDYATSDGTATQKSDYEIASGTLTFAPGETSKVIPILINEDSFVEPNETINVNLSNLSSGTLAGGGLSTVTIVDDDLVLGPNPIDDPATFVCQQYHDFLNREPDAAGAAFWTAEITSCGADPVCIEIKRQNVSAAFFLSEEFGETGFEVVRLQRTAFAKESDTAGTRLTYAQFMHDAQQVGRGVVIGQPGADALLEANKQAYATQIVESAAFIAHYSLALTAAQYVDALADTANVTLTVEETSAAVLAFGAGGTSGRVAALRSVADSTTVRDAEFNSAFVLLQYFGYLRRNPTDAPDVDDSGYQFWLTKLNSFGGNFEQADMVKAFLNSVEYRQRFGP